MSKRVDKVIVDEAAQQPPAITYPLLNPIKAYGEEIRVINMRKPGGQDLLSVGNPVIFSPHVDPPRIEHDYPKVIAMVARLSIPAIPSSSLADLEPADITGLAWAISPFFTPAR